MNSDSYGHDPMTQQPSDSRSHSFERATNSRCESASLSQSSHMSSGSSGRNFLNNMSLIFNMEFQIEQLQLMKEKLLSRNGDVYATFMAEKLKKSFGLRALPSLAESQPIATFEGDTEDDVSFTLVYFNSQETSPLTPILKHYFGSEFMSLMNEVYTLLHNNTLNTSASVSEISEGENGYTREIDEDIADADPIIQDNSFGVEENSNEEEDEAIIPHSIDDFDTDDDMSAVQKGAANGQLNESTASASENQNTAISTPIVKNPQITDQPRADSATVSDRRSNYSIKYCDTNKLILNKKDNQTSSTLHDFNSLPGRGLREHLLLTQKSSSSSKGIYTPNPSKFDNTSSPKNDLSPPLLMIDDHSDPDWRPSSGSKKRLLARRSSDHLRTALMAVKTPNESDTNSGKKWTCNFKNCGKTFSVRSHLDTHKVTHTGEKRYICNFCGGRFTQSSSLRNHRIAIHTKEYPHNCNMCKKGFLLPSQLKKHKSSYHSSKKHSNYSTSSHANALAAKILAAAKMTPTVQPVPTLWTSPVSNPQSGK